jgi:acetyl-CoA carboxylase biotin carboxylase subunit
MKKISKVLIANRGEIAVRIIRACREMDITSVAVYSEIDRGMPHVLMADEAYCIGPAPSRESYLAIEKLIDVARASGADAIHPGYGFLSERAEFAERVVREGLTFVGPKAESIRSMGDKTEARKLVSKAGVPTVPGTPGSISSEVDAHNFCNTVGFPVLIKAAAGGGGKGMRVVKSAAELGQAFRSASSEAQNAFGDGRVYLEKYLESPRHIEFQVLADEHGNTIHLGERECSIQRRHQKVVEETPSVIMDDSLRQKMGETAVNAAKACGYHNAGTIEFLVDKTGNYYFLEMNTRLQVEHPITELRTGIDLVQAQLRIAMGEKLPWSQSEITFRGHAIECRICAEDPENEYLPSTGIIKSLIPASGPGVREDRGIETGCEVSIFYDPMLSKLICWGRDRTEAIARMKRALNEYALLGVKTNIPLLKFVLDSEQFVAGNFDTHFLGAHFSSDKLPKPDRTTVLATAAFAALLRDESNGETPGQVMSTSNSVPGDANTSGPGKWLSKRYDNMRS